MWPPCLAVFIAWTFVASIVITQGHAQCSTGWFGNSCQYPCYCWGRTACYANGTCPDFRCDGGWMGSPCLYKDVTKRSNVPDVLSDNDASTCMAINPSLEVPLVFDVRFTWMRVVASQAGEFDNLQVIFKTASGTEVSPNLTRTLVTATTLDLHGEYPERIQSVVLRAGDPGVTVNVCSVYVSGGRNVAVKQTAFQSSTYDDAVNPVARKAVDGNNNTDYTTGTCTHTLEAPSNWWRVDFSKPVSVNRYILYNRWDGSPCRLQNFELEAKNNNTAIFEYQDVTLNRPQRIYNVPSNTISEVTSVTIRLDVATQPQGYSCQANTILTLCEVEVYGDAICPHGSWGLGCEKTCNCDVTDETCYVSTGMCPSGCKAGYHGLGCEKECERGFYGIDCFQSCSAHCNGTCNRTTGECENGCDQGYSPPMCVNECAPGFSGLDCPLACPENCADTACDKVNGSCINCLPGYIGDFCDEVCEPGFYGKGCITECSVHCNTNVTEEPAVCNHTTGYCLLGCMDGYTGATCQPPGSSGVNAAAIVVPIVLLILIVVAVLVAVWYWRKRRQQHIPPTRFSGDVVHNSSNSAKDNGPTSTEMKEKEENQYLPMEMKGAEKDGGSETMDGNRSSVGKGQGGVEMPEIAVTVPEQADDENYEVFSGSGNLEKQTV